MYFLKRLIKHLVTLYFVKCTMDINLALELCILGRLLREAGLDPGEMRKFCNM